jgi:hypothetical protein
VRSSAAAGFGPVYRSGQRCNVACDVGVYM